jgi:hypothetical protein
MRIWLLAVACLLLAGCDQTTQTTASLDATPATTTPEQLPPIYEPLVDMNKVNADKYHRDLAECRQQAAPQEAAAREAKKQQASGTGLAMASAITGSILPGLQPATDQAQHIGNGTAATAAMSADSATSDYALVVNTCLQHRKYRLLRS